MAIALKSTTVTKIMPLIKVFELMMMMTVIVVPIIIIIIIVGMSIPNTQSRPKNAGGNHRKKTRTHTMPQAGRRETTPSTPTPGPHHPTTPQGGGNHWGGGGGGTAEPGSYMRHAKWRCNTVTAKTAAYGCIQHGSATVRTPPTVFKHESKPCPPHHSWVMPN